MSAAHKEDAEAHDQHYGEYRFPRKTLVWDRSLEWSGFFSRSNLFSHRQNQRRPAPLELSKYVAKMALWRVFPSQSEENGRRSFGVQGDAGGPKLIAVVLISRIAHRVYQGLRACSAQ